MKWILSSSLVGVIIFSSCIANAVSTQKLVTYYTFNNSFKDSSPNHNDAVATGIINFVNGVTNKGANFHSNSYLTAIAPVNQDTSFSVTAWVKASLINSNYNMPHALIYERAANGLDSCGFFSAGNYGLSIYNGKIAFETSTLDDSRNCYQTRLFDFSKTQVNKWYFIAGVYNKQLSRMILYVNGSSRSEQVVGNHLRVVTGAVLRISHNSDSAPQGFEGTIDNLRIYQRALSSNEIKSLYQLRS